MIKHPHFKVLTDRYVRVIQFLYLLSIAIAPIYFGGERLLSWGISGILQSFIAIALAVIPKPIVHFSRWERYLNLAAHICLSLLLLWALIQLLPIPLQDYVHPIWGMASDALDMPISGSIAVSPDEGFLTYIKILIVLVTFFNANTLYRFKLDIYNLILTIPIVAIVYAILGMIWLRYFPEGHIWLDTSPYEKNLVSTFVNRNSFAQYLGVASLCTLAYIMHVWKRKSIHISSLFRLQFYLRNIINTFAFSILLFCTLLISILLTTSRGGIYTTFAGYIVFLFAILRILKDRTTELGIYLVIFMTAGYIIYEAYAGQVGERNLNITDDYTNRLELYKTVWGLIQSRPLTGFGLGGFEAAFRTFMPIEFDPFAIWHRAHNVYLDVAVALGLPATLITIFTVSVPLIIHLIRGLNRASTLSILVISLYVQLSIHSIFDFGLQTGANAITIAAILGASLTQSTRRSLFNQ